MKVSATYDMRSSRQAISPQGNYEDINRTPFNRVTLSGVKNLPSGFKQVDS